MARRSRPGAAGELRGRLLQMLSDFEIAGDLRNQVRSLIPIHHGLRDLGSSLLPDDQRAARDRILYYLTQYPRTVISGDELMVVAGIGEWARRVRELRVQFGWPIITGYTAREIAQDEDLDADSDAIAAMSPDDYFLLDDQPDVEAAARWQLANEIRGERGIGIREKILRFLRANVGKVVTGEELRYVANDKSEWARRVRELRTEDGWPVVTRNTGMPDLPVGTYVLEIDRQSPPHDRRIADATRLEVLTRDGYRCQNKACSWHIDQYNRATPRFLELHHIREHADGGSNDPDNLITLCNACHDSVHAGRLTIEA